MRGWTKKKDLKVKKKTKEQNKDEQDALQDLSWELKMGRKIWCRTEKKVRGRNSKEERIAQRERLNKHEEKEKSLQEELFSRLDVLV